MEKKITIKTKPLVYFRQYLTIVNPLYRLSSQARDILAYLLYLDYTYRDLDEETKSRLILDYDSKVAISNEYNISLATINNTITHLRKKEYQGQYFILGKKLNTKVPILPILNNTKNTLTFEFIIE